MKNDLVLGMMILFANFVAWKFVYQEYRKRASIRSFFRYADLAESQGFGDAFAANLPDFPGCDLDDMAYRLGVKGIRSAWESARNASFE